MSVNATSLNIAPILIHTEDVPAAARIAIRAAYAGPLERRTAWLESAARTLHRETDLDCMEAADVVGLSRTVSCS
jgi:hypothetical protein